MTAIFQNPVSVIPREPMAIGSDTPTRGGMVSLRLEDAGAQGFKYTINYFWEPWSTIETLRDAQLNGTVLDFPVAGNAVIAAKGGLPPPTHPVYGTEADPTQLVGGEMDIWNGQVIVISST